MQTLARPMCRFMRELALLPWLALLALRPCSVRTYILILMLSLTRFAPPIPPPPAVWVMTTRCASEQNRNCHMYIYIYMLYKYITYLALKTMIVQTNIKHINTIGLAAAKAAANPIVCRSLILFCTHCFLRLAMLYIYITYIDIIYIYISYTYCLNI